MHIAHHPLFIALAALTAWLGAWTTLDLFSRVRAHAGGWRAAWLSATAVAMGLSIWSMHFIAMLGFNPGAEVRYDIGLTLSSLLLAIATTAFAFVFARDGGLRREVAGGVVMGAGICTMHYVGMSAVITEVTLVYEPIYVLLAFAVAVSASTSALFVARRGRSSHNTVPAEASMAKNWPLFRCENPNSVPPMSTGLLRNMDASCVAQATSTTHVWSRLAGLSAMMPL